MRDYHENPVVIRNNYLLKKDVMAFVCYVCIFSFFFYILYLKKIEEYDIWFLDKPVYIDITIIVIIIMCFFIGKTVKHFLKHELFIKIYDDKITYDYLTQKGEFKTFTLQKEQIKYIKWGYFPYARLDEKDEIWISDTIKDKFGAYLLSPLNFVLSCIYQILYFITNFSFEKYVLIRFKGGIIAIPKKEYQSNKDIKFEWKSLFNCQILQGGYFGK